MFEIPYFLDQLIGYAFIAIIIILIVVCVKKHQAKKEQEKKQRQYEAQLAFEKQKQLYEYKNKLEGQRIERQQQILDYTEKFLNNQTVLKVAEKFKTSMAQYVHSSPRDIKTEVIKEYIYLTAEFKNGACISVQRSRGGVEYEGTLINFKTENLRPLENPEEMCGFLKAVANQAKKMFKASYPTDENGTKYTLEIDEQIRGLESETCYVSYLFKYSAPNTNYQPPQEWR